MQGIQVSSTPLTTKLSHFCNMPMQHRRSSQEMREATAKMMRATFLSGTDVKPEHLHIASGVAAVLDQLGYLVFDAGDSVLIPAPYYAAFNSDFEVRDGVSVVPVYLSADVTRNHMSNMEPAEALRQLKLALEATESKGSRVRALLLTNPGNPTGRVYSEELLRSMMQWCLDKGIHLISDEVYANAVWNPQAGPRFVSAMRIAEMIRVVSPWCPAHCSLMALTANDMGFRGRRAKVSIHACTLRRPQEHPKLAELVDDHVHVLYGMSKDFALSGAR